jgi:hypothetical protein
MESCIHTTEILEAKAIGTYDFASQVESVKSIDLAMRHYFGADDWLTIRNQRFNQLSKGRPIRNM